MLKTIRWMTGAALVFAATLAIAQQDPIKIVGLVESLDKTVKSIQPALDEVRKFAGEATQLAVDTRKVFAEELHRVGELANDARHLAVPHRASLRARAKMVSNIGTVSLRVNVFC